MTPNKIIAALLDIAQAAHSMLHSGGPVLHSEDIQALDEAVAVLTVLPQFEPEGHLTGPARARKYLESFLVGQHIVGEVADSEPAQEWKAPVDAPAYKPGADFPTSGPISHDFYTHRDNWRELIVKQMNAALEDNLEDHLYIEHELRAFDRAFASLPPEGERRAKPRLDLPTIPVVGKDALIEATRPLFEKAMKADKHRAELDERGLYKGMTEHRFEGWRAAVQTMGFKPGSDDIGALREQAEAWQAVSTALHQHVPEWSKLTTRAMDSAVLAIEKMANSPRKPYTHQIGEAGDKYMETFKFAHPLPVTFRWHELWHALNDAAGTPVENTALLTQVGWRHIMHQEHDQERIALTESKECPWGERGVNFSPEYAVTVAPVYEKAGERPEPEGDASTEVPANPNGTDIRRNHMTKLLMDVKDTISVTVAKRVVSEVGKVSRMSDIPADKIEDVIRACEIELELKGMPTPPPAAPAVPPAPVEWADANHDLSKAPK